MAITKCVSPLANPEMRRLMQDQAMSQFYRPMQAPRQLKRDGLEAFRDLVRDTIGNGPITYLEFGVGVGTSLRAMLTRFTHQDARFYGFDSFDGLPEGWAPSSIVDLPRGAFSTQGAVPELGDCRVVLVRGWFQNSLPPFLATGQIGGPSIHVVHFDADLYSSTSFLLSTLWHHLPEYHFVMDEFMYDEIVALRDFALGYPVEIEFIAECRDKLFGHMRRVPFTLSPA